MIEVRYKVQCSACKCWLGYEGPTPRERTDTAEFLKAVTARDFARQSSWWVSETLAFCTKCAVAARACPSEEQHIYSLLNDALHSWSEARPCPDCGSWLIWVPVEEGGG